MPLGGSVRRHVVLREQPRIIASRSSAMIAYLPKRTTALSVDEQQTMGCTGAHTLSRKYSSVDKGSASLCCNVHTAVFKQSAMNPPDGM